MSVFLLEKSAELLARGLKKARSGNTKAAGQDLLRAAKLLFEAAEGGDPWSRQKRVERAEAILGMIESLGNSPKGSRARTASAADQDPASEWLVTEKPSIALDDVAGLEYAKEQIRIRMIYPFTHPDQAKRYGVKKGGGLLFYGPPGTGKTMLAKAVAGEIDAAFFSVRASDIMSKWVGEAEQNVAKLFSAAHAAGRAIIFIDEVEALIPRRRGSGSSVMRRVVPQILSEMEGFDRSPDVGHTTLFIGATNEPWALDEAVMRPGRLDEKVYIPLPDIEARLIMLRSQLESRPLDPDVSPEEMAGLLEGFSGADIRRICDKASEKPFVESVRTDEERPISRRDILDTIEQVKPSVSSAMVKRFAAFAEGDVQDSEEP